MNKAILTPYFINIKCVLLGCVLFLVTVLHAQTGPGGVDNTTNNVLWLKADVGTSTTTNSVAVSSWADQSGNSNTVTQATANLQPLYMTSIINGFPCIWFDNVSSTNDKMLGKNSATLDGTAGYTFFTVTRPQNLDGSSARAIISKRTTVSVQESFMQFYYTSNKLFTDIETTDDRYNTATTFTNNTNYLIDQLYDGTLAKASRCKTYVGGNLDVTSAETNSFVPNNISPLVIGSTDSSDGRPFGGYIAELIIFRKAVNNAERYIVDNYLSAKYNLTIVNDLYVGDNTSNGDYDFEVAGIGIDASGSNLAFATSRGAGLGITQNSGFGNGDYLLAGHKTPVNSLDSVDVVGITGTGIQRWSRIWYWDLTDAGTAMTVDISFNLNDGGFAFAPNAGVASNYQLIYRSGQSGAWTAVATASSTSGTTIFFNNIALPNGDGYYTIATQQKTASPLPISLLDFTAIANNNKVDIKWTTVTETNNSYFTIEKSDDGKNFNKLINVQGAGNSTSQKDYYESDYQPYNGTSYYRLKQTDFNGNYKYFPIVVVFFNLEKNIKFYPNPIQTNQNLNAQVTGYKNEEILVVLRDVQGKEFYSKLIISEEDTQLFTFDATQQIPPGTYLIVASSNGSIYSQKIIVRE